MLLVNTTRLCSYISYVAIPHYKGLFNFFFIAINVIFQNIHKIIKNDIEVHDL